MRHQNYTIPADARVIPAAQIADYYQSRYASWTVAPGQFISLIGPDQAGEYKAYRVRYGLTVIRVEAVSSEAVAIAEVMPTPDEYIELDLTHLVVHSYMPVWHDDPAEATAAHIAHPMPRSFDDRDRFYGAAPALPLTIADLPGTKWRQCRVGRLLEVTGLYLDETDLPRTICAGHPQADWDYLLDWYGLAIVESWVRVDHLPAEVQLAWYMMELQEVADRVSYCEERIGGINDTPLSGHEYPNNSVYLRMQARDHRRRAAEVIEQMHRFAREHALPPNTAYPPVLGREPGRAGKTSTTNPEQQLKLFLLRRKESRR